jgi:glutamine amidotransferase
MKVGVIDSGLSNLGSVLRWLKNDYDNLIIIKSLVSLKEYDLIVFPGVGSFDSVMIFLKETNLLDELKNYINEGGGYFGICLGFQILFNSSDEGRLPGLGIFDADINKLNLEKNILIPHVGFNEVILDEIEFLNVLTNKSFYFTHSFGLTTTNNLSAENLGYTMYDGLKIYSIINYKKIIGCQFHPEKSSKFGLIFLNSITRWLKKD